MSFTNDLVDGVAQLLEDAGVGAWRPDGDAYAPGETPIHHGSLPGAPDRAFAVTGYVVDEDTGTTDATYAVQVRARAGRDIRVVNDLADAVRDVLHERTGQHVGGVWVVRMWRQSHAYLGVDAGGRHETSSNYYAQVRRASPHLTD